MDTSVKKSANRTRFGSGPGTISLQIREPGSAITHFIGLIAIWIGSGPLLIRARVSGNIWCVVAMVVFLFSATLLYMASTLYHTVVLDRKKTLIFRKLDHTMISVLIAGSYTPVCILVLKGDVGITLLAVIWVLALVGIAIKLFFVQCPKWFSSVLYVAMGWLCIFALKPLYALLPKVAFAWLLAGGISYTVGALIYALKLKKFDEKYVYFGSHEIFHLFIMIGTFCHYVMLYRYVVWM